MKSLVETLVRQLGRQGRVPFAVRFADGREVRYSDGDPAFTLSFRRPRAYWRSALFGHVGLLESYFDGDLDIDGSLAKALEAGMESGIDNQNALVSGLNRLHEFLHSNSSWMRAKHNAEFHYALGPEFYRFWLDDPLMLYTCAYWKDGTRTLEEAQRNKLEHVAKKVLLKPGDDVVDIGSGFGGFLQYAEERWGVKVTGYNTTGSQVEHARRQIEFKRLKNTLAVEADFRSMDRQFDKVVSIGCLEHAGRDGLTDLIRAHARSLKHGGLGLIHFIGHVGHFETDYFIRKYVFPGGWIPSLADVIQEMEKAGLEVLDIENLRRHYALTLDAWGERFDQNWEKIRTLDPVRFDERFRRIWRTYLYGCAEMFRSRVGRTHLFQIVFAKGNVSMTSYPMGREFLYDELAAAREEKEALTAQLRAAGGPVALAKDTSNLFRDRAGGERRRLDVRAFNQVIQMGEGWVDAEGMIPYEDLVRECLAHGVMPTVVPQLKTITLGGAVAGVGIESSSHRHGLVHDGMLELDALLGDGRVVTCTPANEHSDLFFGFPNSYGTLGYALRVRAKTVPVKPFVHLRHVPFTSFSEMEKILEAKGEDFVDATAFSPGKMFMTLGRFADSAPYTSDYKFEKIYYRSIAERDEDYLTVADYVWRWDTDWFWCSKNVLAQNAFFRRFVYGRDRLGSRTYTKIMRWNSRVGVTKKLERVLGLHSESVIQDVDIPLRNAAEFLEFYSQAIGLWPMWICPIGPQQHPFSLYPVGHEWYVNFGFWDVKRTREKHPAGHFNRLIEGKVAALGGIKSLYSDSFFTREEFAGRYGGASYRELKRKYDPAGAFADLYDKCVLRN